MLDALVAALPLAAVIATMWRLRWPTWRAGLLGLALAAAFGWWRFGLTGPVLWVSQLRGLALSLYILYIIWAALLLFRVIHAAGAVETLHRAAQGRVPEGSALALLYAWCLASALEGIAGFGVPIAIVAPLVMAAGYGAVPALAATAVGHAWSVSFGDMGVVHQALLSVVSTGGEAIACPAVILLSIAAVASGIAVGWLLRLPRRQWGRVILVGVVMAAVQAAAVLVGLAALASFLGGVAGLGVGLWTFGRRGEATEVSWGNAAWPYALATLLLAAPVALPAVAARLAQLTLAIPVGEVVTRAGWVTPAGLTKPLPLLLHPGTSLLLVTLMATVYLRREGTLSAQGWHAAFRWTAQVSWPASVGVVLMVALALLMDHVGMTQALARKAAALAGAAYPLLAPGVGLLGALATGSNTSSNVLFGPMQEATAAALGVAPAWVLAAQTAGAALGSMVAPAKLALGCAAVGARGEEGAVMRRTVPVALGLVLLMGLIAMAGA